MVRMREYQAEQRERDSFVLMQHVYTLTDGTAGQTISGARAGDYLCFRAAETTELIQHLARCGYLEQHYEDMISITSMGIEYIERLAWRRRSAREP